MKKMHFAFSSLFQAPPENLDALSNVRIEPYNSPPPKTIAISFALDNQLILSNNLTDNNSFHAFQLPIFHDYITASDCIMAITPSLSYSSTLNIVFEAKSKLNFLEIW